MQLIIRTFGISFGITVLFAPFLTQLQSIYLCLGLAIFLLVKPLILSRLSKLATSETTQSSTFLTKLLQILNPQTLSHSEFGFKVRSVIVSHSLKFIISLLVLAFLAPFYLNSYWLDVLITAGIYCLLALGLNIIVGFAGLLHLGFSAFYAIGAYSYALLNTHFALNFWLALPISAGLSAFAGACLAIPALRLRGDYLAIVTLGFGEIIRIVIVSWQSLTNGPNGITGIEPPMLFGMSLHNPQYFYWLLLMVVVLSVLVINQINRSFVGLSWRAIRDDEIAGASFGINVFAYKLYAMVLGSVWAGIAGVFFASKMGFVSPESFTFSESVLIICMVILGGAGSVSGAILGAMILVFLPELTRWMQDYRMLMVGIGLVLMMRFMSSGILGRKA